MKKRLFIVVNVDWFFLSHRLPIALAAREDGFEVNIVTRNTGRQKEIEAHGFTFFEVPFDRSGSNPFSELECIWRLSRLYRKYKPNIIHHVTLKASLLGCLAAKWSRSAQIINAISGFGYNFTANRNGLKQKLLKRLMAAAFKSRSFQYIFQNPDDISQFEKLDLVPKEHIHLIKGSGVDLQLFAYREEIPKRKVRILLPARMLYDKGVIEFIEAAERIRSSVKDRAEFILAGDCDPHNLAGIPEAELRGKVDGEYIRWIGFQQDMYSILSEADIVVLPSYREGLPKSLIEACAVGKPIITTDTVGCRECVINGWNGYLVPLQDSIVLAEKMEHLISDQAERKQMGQNSRLLAEKEFSIDRVVARHLEIYHLIATS